MYYKRIVRKESIVFGTIALIGGGFIIGGPVGALVGLVLVIVISNA